MGFEPMDPLEPPVFKTGALDHSANLPEYTMTTKGQRFYLSQHDSYNLPLRLGHLSPNYGPIVSKLTS